MRKVARPREPFVLRVLSKRITISPESGRRFPYPKTVSRRLALQLVICGQIDRGVFLGGKWRTFLRDAEALGAKYEATLRSAVVTEVAFRTFR